MKIYFHKLFSKKKKKRMICYNMIKNERLVSLVMLMMIYKQKSTLRSGIQFKNKDETNNAKLDQQLILIKIITYRKAVFKLIPHLNIRLILNISFHLLLRYVDANQRFWLLMIMNSILCLSDFFWKACFILILTMLQTVRLLQINSNRNLRSLVDA